VGRIVSFDEVWRTVCKRLGEGDGGVKSPAGVDFARLILLQVDLSHYLRHLSPLIHVYAGSLLHDNWQGMTEVLEKKLCKSATCPS